MLVLLALTAYAGIAVASAAASSGGLAAPNASTSTSTPQPTAHATSLATWFGPGFYGKETACGQTLTPRTVGVANRTLPCGTLVRVRYGHRVLTVPVLDRGPYSHIGADWDLTAGAARALGINDTVRIATRVVGSTQNGPTLGQPAGEPASPSQPASAPLAGGAVAG